MNTEKKYNQFILIFYGSYGFGVVLYEDHQDFNCDLLLNFKSHVIGAGT
jgi:hypothetical protein